MKQYFEDTLGKEWVELLTFPYLIKTLLPIGQIIKVDRKQYEVYPKDAQGIFSVFRNLPPSKIKVVIVGQDPYHDGSYDGRAFSNNNDSLKVSPSLRNILKEVEDDIYDGLQIEKDSCLKRWEDQGVFLVNRVLTVRAGKPGSHINIGWEEFTSNVIRKLSSNYSNIVFMLWGKNAKSIIPDITGDHLILESGHPSPMSANQGLWFGNKHFSQANEYLGKHKKTKIIW